VYLAFYGLAEKPFNMTPDPRFLYLTPGHREALAQLTYAVREGQGFVALIGDVGTGKTTLLRALLEHLDEKTAVALVVNSSLPFDGILEYVLEDFGVSKAGETRAQRLVALNNFLIERHRAGQKSIIIIDEAQHLDSATLEQLRLLSNFQTARETLLQILLAGQPELRVRLDLPELRQLKQRIALRCAIRPLTPDEVRAYVRFRLRVAGSRDLDLFTDQAITRIAAYAGGIPRVVNTLADHCLLIGYADQRRRVNRDTVDEAIAYLEDGAPAPRRRAGTRARARRRVLQWAIAGGTAVLGVTAAVALAALVREGLLPGSITTSLESLLRAALGFLW
jgi:general secretion pathway protein A